MLCRGWRWAFVLGSGLAFTRTSTAEPTPDEGARLVTLLRKGDDAAKAKDWAGCVDARWDALAIEDSARISGDLGLCEEQAGRFGDAMNHLLRALAAATPDMIKTEPWKSYQAAVIRLRSQVAMVVITLEPTDAYLVVDGRPYGKADGRTIAMSYGKHTLVARAEGHEDASETRLLTAPGVPNIHLTLKPKAKPPAPATLPAPDRSPPPPRATVAPRADSSPAPQAPFPCLPARSARGVLVPLACAGVAVFAASAAAAIGLEVHAASLRGALAQRGARACLPGNGVASPAECADLESRVRQRTDAANVVIGTGIAAGVLAASAGLAIALEPAGPKVTAAASVDGGGIIVQGVW